MDIGHTFMNIIEVGIGLVYLVGAGFSSIYTLRHGEGFYGGFAEGAWFKPSRWFVRNLVMPRSMVFTGLLIIFQLIVALSILTRGILVQSGLIAGAVFSLVAVMASNIPGALANLALALFQLFLAFTR